MSDAIVRCRLGSSAPYEFLVDSGADVNIVGGYDWASLERELRTGMAKLEPIDPIEIKVIIKRSHTSNFQKHKT